MNTKKNKMMAYVFEKVESILETEYTDGFRSLARSFPSMIQKNGLNVAIIYLYSSCKNRNDEYALYLKIIEDRFVPEKDESKQKLLNKLVNMDSSAYRMFANEIMDLCLWIKRFAEGMISKNG